MTTKTYPYGPIDPEEQPDGCEICKSENLRLKKAEAITTFKVSRTWEHWECKDCGNIRIDAKVRTRVT